MAINFPLSLDSLSNPSSGNKLDNPSHSSQHGDANDILEALETKLGIGASSAGSATAGFPLVHSSGGTTAWAQVGYEGITSGTATSGQVLTAQGGGTALWASPKIVQVAQTRYTTATTIASASMTDTGLSASITCSTITNKVLVMITQNVYMARSASPQGVEMDLQRNGSTIETFGANGYATFYMGFAGLTNMNLATYISYSYLDSPASTSALTYKTRGRVQNTANSGTSTFQWESSPSTITLMEIQA